MTTTTRRPQAIIDALVSKAAEVMFLEPEAVMVSQRAAPSAARAACWEVLREAGWLGVDIAEAFGRGRSAVAKQRQRSRHASATPEHLYLVGQLRRVLREEVKAIGFANIEARTRAQLWALDQELAAATALRDQLDARIGRVQRLRAQLAYSLSDIAVTEDVITRGDRRQLQEVS